MKPDDFDKDLRTIAGNFDLPVRDDVFAQVMQTRTKKRRRFFAFYLCGFATLLVAVATGVYKKNAPETPAPLAVHTANAPGVPQQKHANDTKTGRVVPLPNKQQITTTLKQPDTNPAYHAANNLKKTALQRSSPSIIIAGESNHETSSFHEKIPATAEHNGTTLLQANTAIDKPGHEPQQADSLLPVLAATADSASVLVVADSLTPVDANTQAPKIKAERLHLAEIGIYANYFAITNAINASSLIPFNKQDSFGLNEKANYAFSTGIRGSYQFHKKWKATLGIGIYKLQFDQVRIAQVRVDSIKWNELTNTGIKGIKAFTQNISERSFTWLEIPAGIAYTTPLSSKISFCAEIGLVYQTLLQNSVYEFTTSSAGDLNYHEKNNTGYERLNKNTAALYVQPGFSANLTKRISVLAGLSYRKQLVSYYKKDYFPTGSFYLLGANINFMYKF